MVIAEPVYPADSPARSAMSASAVASPALGTAAALKFQPARAASSGVADCQTCRWLGAAGGLIWETKTVHNSMEHSVYHREVGLAS